MSSQYSLDSDLDRWLHEKPLLFSCVQFSLPPPREAGRGLKEPLSQSVPLLPRPEYTGLLSLSYG